MSTLAEVKKIIGDDRVYETESCFIFNDVGKYGSKLTFVLGKDFLEGVTNRYSKGILDYRNDKNVMEMVANMNVKFGGEATVMFGDFWVSQKGSRCFRPLPPRDAKHILINVGWGGAFNRTRGSEESDNVGELYYARRSSNGGGAGRDYWVFPLGYRRVIRDEEFDGPATRDPTTDQEIERRAAEIRRIFTETDAVKAAKEAAIAKAAKAEEDASRAAKPLLEPKIMELVKKAEEVGVEHRVTLGDYTWYGLSDTGFIRNYLYTDGFFDEFSRAITSRISRRLETIAKEKARAEWEPKIREAFTSRIEAIGYTPKYLDDYFQIDLVGGWSADHVYQPYSEEGFKRVEAMIADKEKAIAHEVARKERKAKKAARVAAAPAEETVEVEHETAIGRQYTLCLI